VPAFKFQPSQPTHSILVPTVDTCRYGSLLQGCMAAGRPVLLVGGTGVGKSAIVKVGLLMPTRLPWHACNSCDIWLHGSGTASAAGGRDRRGHERNGQGGVSGGSCNIARPACIVWHMSSRLCAVVSLLYNLQRTQWPCRNTAEPVCLLSNCMLCAHGVPSAHLNGRRCGGA
jgi:hypothetical protein